SSTGPTLAAPPASMKVIAKLTSAPSFVSLYGMPGEKASAFLIGVQYHGGRTAWDPSSRLVAFPRHQGPIRHLDRDDRASTPGQPMLPGERTMSSDAKRKSLMTTGGMSRAPNR